jgi:hypothetical protein
VRGPPLKRMSDRTISFTFNGMTVSTPDANVLFVRDRTIHVGRLAPEGGPVVVLTSIGPRAADAGDSFAVKLRGHDGPINAGLVYYAGDEAVLCDLPADGAAREIKRVPADDVETFDLPLAAAPVAPRRLRVPAGAAATLNLNITASTVPVRKLVERDESGRVIAIREEPAAAARGTKEQG